MWQIVDISGFRTSSTTHGRIIKYKKVGYTDLHFELIFTNDYHQDDEYHFDGDNISEILKFHNILKNNGSSIIYHHNTSQYVLIGKKLMSILEDDELFKLEYFSTDPIILSIEHFIEESTNEKLVEIFKNQWNDDYSNPYWNIIKS